MPFLNEFKCKKCGFSMPSGWGGYMYVEDDNKRRIVCPHPGERWTIAKVLGENASKALIRARTGYNSDCLCLDCLHKFAADLEVKLVYSRKLKKKIPKTKDERLCPVCKSTNVKTTLELIGNPCPKCKEGIFQEIDTGKIC